MISRCTTEYYACYSRDQSCSDVLTCIADCEESSCENPCKTEGTAEAQIAMDDLRICVNQACIGEYPFPGDSCWDEAVAAGGDCAAEYAICVGD